MKIQFTFGNLKWLKIISYLMLMAGMIGFLAGSYEFVKIHETLEQSEKMEFLFKEVLAIGLNGLIFFLLLKWIADRLHTKQFNLTIQ